MSHAQAFQLHHAALDAVPSALAVLDHGGLIVEVNQAWHRFNHDNGLLPPHAAVGSNYLQACETGQSTDGQAAAEGIRKVISGEMAEYFQVYPCHSTHEHRWFRLCVTPFTDAPLLMLIHENITELH
ncbi:PAS domain-containing protein [Deinococcus sp. KSM4-11]|uniref:PAS domain-containing protein n=1 Tax=Deinococcus sp. KSM4-11 TaxID=2568654 RepID=UPI001454CB83|nr:PAS domain-containing protein [Deinococcus sp. KSM4-11]